MSAGVGPAEREVETDPGPTRFLLTSEDGIHRLGDHRALLVDAHGLRYLIAASRALDTASRRILEHHL